MNAENDESKKIDAIILDLDGTLLNSDKCISKYTLEILRKCKEQGIILGIATARSAEKAKFYSEKIIADFILYNNGALIEYQGRCVSKLLMNRRLTIKLLGTLLQSRDNVGCVTLETLDGYCKIGNIFEIGLDWKNKFNVPTLKITAEIFSEDIIEQMKIMFSECRISSFREGNWYRFADIRAKKSRAIDFLRQDLGIPSEKVVAFGDDFDDMEMLVKAGVGVAVKNAVKALIEVADFVCEDSDQNGVATYIDNYILSKL